MATNAASLDPWCGNRLNIFDKYISEIGHCAVLFVYIPVLTGFGHVRFL